MDPKEQRIPLVSNLWPALWMWDVKACRSCLTVKGKLEKIGDASKRLYTAITGLQIADGDGYPVYFCVECRHHIRKSLAFRRKSRRAHFVLKEIMAVRKKVTYSDIVTVNRKKTNLESSLNFWEPHHNSCYLLANDEGAEPESLQKYDIGPAQYSRFRSKPIIDIKPDVNTEIPEETSQKDDEPIDNDMPLDDIPTNDYLEPAAADIDPANIDMNDIFKDLKTEADDQSDENDVTEEPVKKSVPKKIAQNKSSRRIFAVTTLVSTMMMFDLKVLDLETQKEKMEFRKRQPPFVHAPYKCAMCLSVHKTMQHLLEHVEYHNVRKFPHECKVCKNKFPSEEELNIHVAECHMYEYTCRMCKHTVFSQKDAVAHVKERHVKEGSRIPDVQRKKELNQALANFKISPMSQQMMHDVKALRAKRTKPVVESDKPGDTENTFNCDICHVSRTSRERLEKHMVIKHRYVYTCQFCQEVFTTRAQALDHNDKAHADKHTCNSCGKRFMRYKNLQNHVKIKHFKWYPCNLCGHASKSERFYYVHQLKEHGYISINDPLVGDPQYVCGQCNVQFADKRSLDKHLVVLNHAGANSVPFSCIPCKKVYNNAEELETHFVTCRDARTFPRQCCYCEQMLHDSIDYKTHYIHSHPDLQYRYLSQNSICYICGKSIFKPLLEAHIRGHTNPTGLSCRLCPAQHATPAQSISHLLAQHARRPYRCALCVRRFKFRADCKDHVLKVHAPTKLFKCEFCGKEFSYWRNLKEHSESVHNLTIPPIRTKAFKSKDKIFVYAHTKIIINELEREKVEKVQVELIDYLEQKSKPVEYHNYFLFSPDAEETATLKTRKRDRRKKKPTELESAVANISVEHSGALKIEKIEVLSFPEQGTVKLEVLKENVEGETSEVKEVKREEVKREEVKREKVKREKVKREEVKREEVQQEQVEEQGIMEVEEDSSPPLEVIENDGHQFVMIDGEMYRIANEDEEE